MQETVENWRRRPDPEYPGVHPDDVPCASMSTASTSPWRPFPAGHAKAR